MQSNNPNPEVYEESVSVGKYTWICINCWEVVHGNESKLEHVYARHLLTSSFADSEPPTAESYIKLSRIYGRINPEETHVVLFYVPHYVRDAVVEGLTELPHVLEARERHQKQILRNLASILIE